MEWWAEAAAAGGGGGGGGAMVPSGGAAASPPEPAADWWGGEAEGGAPVLRTPADPEPDDVPDGASDTAYALTHAHSSGSGDDRPVPMRRDPYFAEIPCVPAVSSLRRALAAGGGQRLIAPP
eukprot:scaffold35810_cov78-Phaeocystis_antarctica.AAC.2